MVKTALKPSSQSRSQNPQEKEKQVEGSEVRNINRKCFLMSQSRRLDLVMAGWFTSWWMWRRRRPQGSQTGFICAACFVNLDCMLQYNHTVWELSLPVSLHNEYEFFGLFNQSAQTEVQDGPGWASYLTEVRSNKVLFSSVQCLAGGRLEI